NSFLSSKRHPQDMCVICSTDSFKSLNFGDNIRSLLSFSKNHLILHGTHLIEYINDLSLSASSTIIYWPRKDILCM
ncbi:hypothetical protein RJ639_005742, partial [Escallonia herrerae]